MWLRVLTFSFAVFGGAAAAQDDGMPPEVVDECNATVTGYHKMPDCLKGGLIGFRMLEVARGDAFYGAVAEEVAKTCAEVNEGYYRQWLCLRNAAGKAVEIRELIGVEQMTDRCYRALSDPATHARLLHEEKVLRMREVGASFWSGMSTYRAYDGCPEDTGQGAEDDDDQAGGHAHTHEDDGGGYTPEACRAYGEVEQLLRARDAARLRESFAALRALPEDERLDALTRHGLSPESAATLREELEGEAGLGAAILLMGLLRGTHPALFDEVMAMSGEADGPVADAMAAGVIDLLMGGVVDSYRTACPVE